MRTRTQRKLCIAPTVVTTLAQLNLRPVQVGDPERSVAVDYAQNASAASNADTFTTPQWSCL